MTIGDFDPQRAASSIGKARSDSEALEPQLIQPLTGEPRQSRPSRQSRASADPFGCHRVLEPKGALPQAAWKLDNTMVCRDNEILIDVETLNIDSASFAQIKGETDGREDRVADIMRRIVAERGKHHNPVTGSGGMLVGRVAQVGAQRARRGDVRVGDRIATLVSLSLTPLFIEEIQHIDMHNAQVKIRGQAILFESGIFAHMPTDIPDNVALAIFDICGAPAQTARLVKPEQTVVILGAGGKSGLAVLKQARLSAGRRGRIVAVEYGEEACTRLRRLGWADAVLNLDATEPVKVWQAVQGALADNCQTQDLRGATDQTRDPSLADVVINCVNVPGTEMSAILCARDGGTVYFFSMATSFTAAALGAEGVGKDVTMVVGNGYCHGHADHAINLIRNSPELLAVYNEKFTAHS